MQKPVNAVTRIMSLVRLERKEITSIYFHAILNGLIQLSLPIGIQSIINFVLGGALSASLIILITLVVGGVLCAGLLQIGQMRIIEKIQQKLFVRYTHDFADRIPKLDLRKLDNYYLPGLMNHFFEIPTLQKSMSKLLLDIPTATIQMLFGLLLLSLYHPAFILFGILLVAILWGILYYSGNNGLNSSIAESGYKYEVASWLQELARLVKSFRFSKGSSINLKRADEKTSQYLSARNAHFSILQFQFKILVVFKVLITASMLIVGSFLLVNQQLNIGQFIAAEIVIITVIGSVEKLIGNLESVYDVLTSVEKIGKITDKPLETNGSYVLPYADSGLSVELKNLTFGYTDESHELNNISCKIQPGQKICITGPEGSGKSTLLRLLTGAYDGYEGSILVNGLPLGNYNRPSLRSQTGILLSQQDIYNATLWENITMGNDSIETEQVIRLFEKTGLSGYLASLKKGFDTMLETSGKRLSRNVIHKILLVRALAGNPRLLLLEEPWLGLEENYATQVKNLLLQEFPGTTVLIVSNDEVFAARCDQQIRLS